MITLTLENFRCWENNTFTFPDHGICLINGRSGRGKSTLLNAIYYAISGKLKNITTFGKKNTKVTLLYETDTENIKIIRTRNPVRVVVEFEHRKYEDEEAQTVIDRHFGKFFGSTSYIDQENTFSFFSLSASDKMEFLENLLMEEQSVESIREKIKNQISDSKVQFASIESKISSLVEVLTTLKTCSLPSLTIGENKVTPSNVDLLIEKVTKNLSVTCTNSEISFSKIKKMEDYLQIFHTKTQINDIQSEILKLENEYSSIEQLHLLEKEKNELSFQKEWFKLEQSIEECQKELEQKKKEMEEKIKMLDIYSYKYEPEDLKKLHQSKKWLEQLFELDEKMNQSIENKESEKEWLEQQHFHLEGQKDILYKLELSKKSLHCPLCHTPLQMIDNHLEQIENIKDINYEELDDKKREYEKDHLFFRKRQKIFDNYLHMEDEYNQLYNKVEKILSSYGLEMDMDCVEHSIHHLQLYEEYQKKMEMFNEDRFLKSLFSKREELKKKSEYKCIQNIQNIQNYEIDKKYDDIVQKLTLFKDKHERYNELSIKKRELEKKINTNEEIYENIDVDEKLENERKKYRDYEEKKQKYRDYLDQLKQWKSALDHFQKREKIEYQIEREKERRDDYSDRMKGLVKLRDYVKIAEKKCLEEFIQSLNHHASIYLEHFFQEEDLKVELKSTQELKNGKEKICLNFEIYYRDLIGDLSYLSGGERDRVMLAFTLAFSEIIHPSLLMLDECISSLDAETTSNVLDTLKEKYRGKLVLLVSHQANLGFFDTVINI